MNKHLWQRIESLLTKYDQAVLATCGITEPQASIVRYRTQDTRLHLFLAHTSDHLFNLETKHDLVLLSPEWKLHGRGWLLKGHTVTPPHAWQVIVSVQLVRLHILNADGSGYAETIDCEELQGEI